MATPPGSKCSNAHSGNAFKLQNEKGNQPRADAAPIMQTNITARVKNLLETEGSPFAERFHAGLEVQIQPFGAAALEAAGYPITWPAGEQYRYAWPIRIPKNANATPVDNDRPMRYAVDAIKLIGWTGWNWRDLQSEFFIVDVDAASGHAAGLPDEKLEATRAALCSIPYVALRQSKGGNGYHAYVEFANAPHTANHGQHAALARAVLKKMSAEAGFDFSAAADVVGGNAWFFERKTPKEID